MYVCYDCAREMKCAKNGVACIYNGNHVYFGDLFTCECGNSVVATNYAASHAPDYVPTEDDLFMEQG